MAAKKTPAELVVASPEWPVPSREQLEEIEYGHLINIVRKHHEGLCTIRIEVLDAEKQSKGTLQKFELLVGDGGVPLLGADHVAQLIRARSIRYAIDEDLKTQFRIWLQGKSTTGRDWQQQTRLTVDPQVTEDYQDAADDDFEDDDDDFDDDGPDEDNEVDEPEDDDDDPRLQSNGRSQPIPQQHAAHSHAPSPQPGYAPPRPADVEPRTLPPSHSLHPSVEIARQQGIEVKPQDMQVQLSPDFMLALMSVGEERVARMIAPLMKEMRLGMQSIRRESSRVARDARMTARMVARAAVAQQVQSQKRQDQLEERFIKTCELNYSSYENFQLIAQQGWTAFRNSMEKEAEYYVRMREYDRALLGQQLDIAHNTNRTSATSSIMSYGAPIALAVGSGIMRKRGEPWADEVADLLGSLAKGFAPSGGDEDDDEEEAEAEVEAEDVIDTDAAEAPPRAAADPSTKATSNGASHRWEISSTPAILGSRAFLESLSAEQIKQLQQIMPKSGWDAVLGAANAQIEQAALASMAILKGIVMSDPSIVIRVNGVLDPKQRNTLLKLIQISNGAKPKGRGIPRRPQAAASS